MKFLVSKTYAIVTPESASEGDFAETGFEFKDQEYSLSDLKHLIKSEGFFRERNRGGKKSCPCSTWLESDPEEDHSDGSAITYNLHVELIK